MASLYRKWRSRSFEDLIGQDHVTRTLRNAIMQHRIAHAYLFTGPRGTGKTSTARILAKGVNCLHPDDGNPCNDCEMCVAVNQGRALDVIEIDAASNTSVENVRDLRERVAYAAGEGTYKVYIVDEVHRLSGAAFDAFLKTLEEPPPHVIFVFASTEPHKVPATIMSRCQRFDFRRIPPAETLERIRFVVAQEDMQASDDALHLIAQHAAGSLRDALGLLDQVASFTQGYIDAAAVRAALGLADPEVVARLTDALLSGETGSGLAECNRFVASGGDPSQVIEQLVEYWRALLLQVSRAPLPDLPVDPTLLEQLPGHAAHLTAGHVVSVLRAFTVQQFSSKYNLPPELPLEMAFVEAALALGAAPIAASPGAAPGMPATSEHRGSLSTVSQSAVNRLPDPTPQPSAHGAVMPNLGPVAPAAGELPENGVNGHSPPSPSVAEPNGAPADVAASWDAVIAAMRPRSRSLEALLRSGHVLAVQNGEIVVGFVPKFHVEQLSNTKQRKLLEEVVAEVVGVPYRVTVRQTTKAEVSATRGPEALEEDDGFIEEVAERLRQYHARELGNGTS